MSFTVIVPSRSEKNAVACVGAVRAHEPAAEIIVVSDGLPPAAVYRLVSIAEVRVVQGIKPFIFSRNCNIGIREAGEPDVVLLNDDALLRTPGGFTALSQAAAEGYGIVASTASNTGNAPQRRGDLTAGVRPAPGLVAFICVYIPRATFERIGLLDEDYTDYGRDDDDYCYRAIKAGVHIGICDGCFVDHATLPSEFRRRRGPLTFDANDAAFERKHGVHPCAVDWSALSGVPA